MITTITSPLTHPRSSRLDWGRVGLSVFLVHAIFFYAIFSLRLPTQETSNDPIFVTIESTPASSSDNTVQDSTHSDNASSKSVLSDSVLAPADSRSIPELSNEHSTNLQLSEEPVDIPLDKRVDKSSLAVDKSADKPVDKPVQKQVNVQRTKSLDVSLTSTQPSNVKAAKEKSTQAPASDNASFPGNNPDTTHAGMNQQIAETVVVTQLDYRYRPPQPEYPVMAARARQQGRVVIRLVISTTGEVMSATVVQSAGSSLLDQSALAAAKQAKFIPYTRGGKQYQAQADVPFEFVLKSR